MHKRSVSRVHHVRNCLGFEIKYDGKFLTKVKKGFEVASDWPHLNLLACKVGIELVWEKPNAKDLMEAGSLMTFINGEFFEYHTKWQLRIEMLSLQLYKELNASAEFKMQGTLVNLPFLNYLLSQDIFKTVLFPDKLISFWYKMRHNVLLCNFTLSKWYGTDPRCKIDGYHIESMAHLLNNCKEPKKNYSARHNKICKKLCFELTGLWRAVFLDKTAKTSFEELNLNFTSRTGIFEAEPGAIRK